MASGTVRAVLALLDAELRGEPEALDEVADTVAASDRGPWRVKD